MFIGAGLIIGSGIFARGRSTSTYAPRGGGESGGLTCVTGGVTQL